MAIDSGADLIMILLFSPGESGKEGEAIRGITRLQKLVFLLLKEANLEKRPLDEVEFEAYDYGPYSTGVANIVEALKEIGLIEIEEKQIESYREVVDGIAASLAEDDDITRPRTVEVYGLSDEGMKVGQELFNSLSPYVQESIQKIKTKYNSIKLLDLLKYVYSEYPETKERSKITDMILGYGRRPELSAYEREE